MSAIAGGTAGLSIATPAGRGRKRGSSAATSRAAAATSDAVGVESLGGRSSKRKDAVAGGGEAGDDDDDVLSKPASSRLGATGAAATAGADQGGHASAGAADREGTDGRGAAAGFRDGEAATGGHRRAVSGNFAWLGTSTSGAAHAVKAALKSSLVALGAARSPASAAGKGALSGRSAGAAGEESVRAAAAQRLSAVLRHPAVPVVLPMMLAVVISAYFLRLVPGGGTHSVADESGWRLWWGANRAERMAAAASAAAKAQQAAVERLQEVVVRLEKRTESMAQALQVQVDTLDSKLGAVSKEQEVRAAHAAELEKRLEQLGVKVQETDAAVLQILANGGPMVRQEVVQLVQQVAEERAQEVEGRVLTLDDVRAAAKRVVEEQLQRHLTDDIERADYALATGGGRVVAHSDALYTRQQQQQRQQKRRWSQVVSTVSPLASSGAAGAGAAASSGKEPEADLLHPNAQVVLTPGRFPGNCLPLKGQQGHIDIRLRSTIVPRAFTLEHLPKLECCTVPHARTSHQTLSTPCPFPWQSIAYEIHSAPKDVEFWGRRPATATATTAAATAAAGSGGGNGGGESEAAGSSSAGGAVEEGEWQRLAVARYELEGGPVQTFSVGEAVEEGGGGDGVGIGMVRVRVLSNYGHPNFTCIYRVRAHGDALGG
ncbi:unnamed protein product [Closterium sp. Naga37s-1]|nr:unnamed protein product [Closterium sp. Naga37s-1]